MDNRRRQLDVVADVLRQFGITDSAGIGEYVAARTSLSRSALVRRVSKLESSLPCGVTTDFVANALLSRLQEPSEAVVTWREQFPKSPRLRSLKKGRSQAGEYHRHIFELLKAIFHGRLTNPTIEQGANQGTQRIDIHFDNRADRGFFQEMREKWACDFVPVECKNYTSDVGGEEYDQLSGRLSKKYGQLGLLVCREIVNRKRALIHCQSRLHDKDELLVVLEDADIIALHQAKWKGCDDDVDSLLHKKVRAIRRGTTT